MTALNKKPTSALFESLGAILDELKQRNIVRSSNSPIADYAEALVCRALNLTREAASTKGFDARDHQGRRYEIKGRRLTPWNKSRQLSAIRDLDGKHFEFLVVVLFAADFSVQYACRLPAARVMTSARYKEYVNGHIIHANDKFFAQDGAKDITTQVRRATR